MRSKQINLYYYKAKNILKEFFYHHYKILIILAFVGLFGIATGILTASKYSSKLELNNISNETFVKFLKNNTGIWSLFFSYFLRFSIISAIAIFINIKPFCIGFNIITLCFWCYINAFDFTIVILLYGLAGILCTLIILVPFFIVLLFIYLVISSIAIKNNILKHKFGKNCSYTYSPLKLYLLLLGIATIVLIIQSLIMPTIRIWIIV